MTNRVTVSLCHRVTVEVCNCEIFPLCHCVNCKCIVPYSLKSFCKHRTIFLGRKQQQYSQPLFEKMTFASCICITSKHQTEKYHQLPTLQQYKKIYQSISYLYKNLYRWVGVTIYQHISINNNHKIDYQYINNIQTNVNLRAALLSLLILVFSVFFLVPFSS